MGPLLELDILEAVLQGKELPKITAGKIMTKKPTTADVDTPLPDIVKMIKVLALIQIGRMTSHVLRKKPDNF